MLKKSRKFTYLARLQPSKSPLPVGRKSSRTRAEQRLAIREAIFSAAVKVVGREGYSNAIVSMITSEADVAQGTFYNYFDTRQDLFDELLPKLGGEMLEFIGEEASAASNALEREERSFRAFFTFLKMRPEFYRILYEAEIFAPKAFEKHTNTIARGYVRTLERAAQNGELRETDPQALEAIAFTLMGARHYLCMRFVRVEDETRSIPEWLVRVYMDQVSNGVYKVP